MKGRKKKPTQLKVIEGNRGKRPLPDNEPKPLKPEKIPLPPSYLNAVAKKEWQETAKKLHRLGLLTEIDLTALAGYCDSYSTWLACNEIVEKTGILIKTKSGYPVVNPALPQASKAMAEMRKWLTEFGMTPSSRARVSILEKGERTNLDNDGM